MLKILNVEPSCYDPEARLTLARVAEVDYLECQARAQLVTALAGGAYQALCVGLGIEIDAAVMAAAPHLRWIVTPTTGLDHIDLATAQDRGIQIISLRGETAFLEQIPATAEHAWGLLLCLARRTAAAFDDVRAGRWRRTPFAGKQLRGRCLGILGYGRIGRMVARYAAAFDMSVVAHDVDATALARAPEGVRAVSLDELLGQADVVSIHLPLDASTRGLLSEQRMARMKRDALLINTARGAILDQDGLLRALESGHLGGAALDVLADESGWSELEAERHPLLAYARRHDNLIITPHIGGYAMDAIRGARRFVCEKLVAAITRARSSEVTP